MTLLERAGFIGKNGDVYKLQFVNESINEKEGNIYNFIHFDDSSPSGTIIPMIRLTQDEIDLISIAPDQFFDTMLKMYNNKHLMQFYVMLNDDIKDGIEYSSDGEIKSISSILLIDEGVSVSNSKGRQHGFSKNGDVYIINIWLDYIALSEKDLERMKEMIVQYNNKSTEIKENEE